MKKRLTITISLFTLLTFTFIGCGEQAAQTEIETTPDSSLNLFNMEITSSAFENAGAIPSKYTCDGENIIPPLTISGVPSEAASLAIVFDDQDAPGGTWVHWLAWNIDPKTKEIKEGQTPENAIEGYTSFESNGYGGPCPHSGIHRYFFRIYALDAMLEIHPNSDKTLLEMAMKDHVVDQATLFATYSRN